MVSTSYGYHYWTTFLCWPSWRRSCRGETRHDVAFCARGGLVEKTNVRSSFWSRRASSWYFWSGRAGRRQHGGAGGEWWLSIPPQPRCVEGQKWWLGSCKPRFELSYVDTGSSWFIASSVTFLVPLWRYNIVTNSELSVANNVISIMASKVCVA
jgi:hypothetical protein